MPSTLPAPLKSLKSEAVNPSSSLPRPQTLECPISKPPVSYPQPLPPRTARIGFGDTPDQDILEEMDGTFGGKLQFADSFIVVVVVVVVALQQRRRRRRRRLPATPSFLMFWDGSDPALTSDVSFLCLVIFWFPGSAFSRFLGSRVIEGRTVGVHGG